MRACGGLTLFDLLVAMAVGAILVGAGMPAFDGWVRDNRRVAEVNGLVTALHLARSEAIKRGHDAALCPTGIDGQCAGAGAPWHAGWMVFANLDADYPPELDAGEPVILHHGQVKGITIRANRPAFVYRPHGKNATNGSFIFCDDRGSESARAIIVSPTGRPRTAATTASGGTLPCDSD